MMLSSRDELNLPERLRQDWQEACQTIRGAKEAKKGEVKITRRMVAEYDELVRDWSFRAEAEFRG